ncbi:putative quorum-sensing-regulated virulence factor [Bythopirellula polymerisocia]|uniref:Uncharacterized protein n=1 Tax=Bythopirellula polymerisocia TaxID=2528003 RepID=A0A5C6CRK1_9BACT|nr:DUF3820 family protein [Bythopirellula polymerisocia]TWU27543.1 hypothetical protein Pla144_23200 [Bythopirellula polymerisocia]
MNTNSTYIPARQNTRSTAFQSVPWWLNSTPPVVAETPETPEIPEENEPIEPETAYAGQVDPAKLESFPRFPEEYDADNEFYWSQLSDHDREYLQWHREYPPPCAWCGGRTRHSPLCDELRALWQLSLPFGKFKGMAVSAVPMDYLIWLTENSDSLDCELRDAIQERLKATPPAAEAARETAIISDEEFDLW